MNAEVPQVGATSGRCGDGATTVGAQSLTSFPVGSTVLDELDRQLIGELQHDGRTPFADLARATHSTEKTVRRRVARLLAERYVTISVVTDPALLGFNAMCLALITTGPGADPTVLAQQLSDFDEVDYVTVTTGPFTLQAELICVDAAEMQAAVRRIQGLTGVAGVELLAFLRLHYQQAEFTRTSSGTVGHAVRPQVLDDLDQQIIFKLSAGGRISLREIAREAGVSEATIRHRFSRVTETGAVRVLGIVNPLRMGYGHTSWVGVRVQGSARAQDVADAFADLPNVSYVALTAGRFDVLAEVLSSSGEELIALLDDSIRPIAGIEVTETWVYQQLLYKPLHPR